MTLALRMILFVAVLGGTLFGSAGRWDLPFFWIYIAIPLIITTLYLPRLDRGLIEERMRPGPGGRDRLLRFVVLPFFLAHLVVAGLDVGHWQGTAAVPFVVQIGGVVGFAGSMALATWAMTVNRFFSPVVRIQEDRGHRLITAGPYGWVRHPGYIAALGSMLCAVLTLGSYWSILPLLPPMLLILRRTIIEDGFLLEHLDGYREYAGRVRYRLLPGVW